MAEDIACVIVRASQALEQRWFAIIWALGRGERLQPGSTFQDIGIKKEDQVHLILLKMPLIFCMAGDLFD